MLAKSRDAGGIIRCDACQTEISGGGKVLWKFNGEPITNVLVVHDGCEASSVVAMLLPRHRSMPLGLYVEQLLERISV